MLHPGICFKYASCSLMPCEMNTPNESHSWTWGVEVEAWTLGVFGSPALSWASAPNASKITRNICMMTDEVDRVRSNESYIFFFFWFRSQNSIQQYYDDNLTTTQAQRSVQKPPNHMLTAPLVTFMIGCGMTHAFCVYLFSNTPDVGVATLVVHQRFALMVQDVPFHFANSLWGPLLFY